MNLRTNGAQQKLMLINHILPYLKRYLVISLLCLLLHRDSGEKKLNFRALAL